MNMMLLDKTVKNKDPDKIISANFDSMFKSLTQSMEFRPCLNEILDELTPFSREDIENHLYFRNTEVPKEKFGEKGMTTDILMDIKGNIINLEANSTNDKSLRIKNDGYAHKITYEKNALAKKIRKNHFIQINFDMKKRFKTDDVVLKFSLMDESGKFVDEKNFQKIYLNIENAVKKWYNGGELTFLEKVLVLLQITSRKELREFVKGDKILMGVARKIEELNLDPEIIGLYNKQKMEAAMKEFDIREATESGEAIGFKQGKYERNIEIAKSMLKDGMDISKISKFTGLTAKEISNL